MLGAQRMYEAAAEQSSVERSSNFVDLRLKHSSLKLFIDRISRRSEKQGHLSVENNFIRDGSKLLRRIVVRRAAIDVGEQNVSSRHCLKQLTHIGFVI